jgi:PUA-domain protein
MSQKHRRYTLKSRESRQIVAAVSRNLSINLEATVGPKVGIETVDADFGELLLVNGKPLLFKVGEAIYPTLQASAILAHLSKVIVDMGAVRFVCNGADVMAPGIVGFEGDFSKGDILVVMDVTHRKPLALGDALYPIGEAEGKRQGSVVKNRHYVGDKIWNFAKTLTE